MARDAEFAPGSEPDSAEVWRVAEAVADGSEPDWSSREAQSPDSEPIIHELLAIQAIARRQRLLAERSQLESDGGARGEDRDACRQEIEDSLQRFFQSR